MDPTLALDRRRSSAAGRSSPRRTRARSRRATRTARRPRCSTRHYRVAPRPARARHVPEHHRQRGDRRSVSWRLRSSPSATLFYGTYPITPASDILHQLSGYKNFGVKTFQAEDEIAAIGAAIGASYGGALGLTGTSGPGIALKTEAMGLAVMVELPLVVIDVQRAGPSTGMPTKTEQADLLQVMLRAQRRVADARSSRPATPAECFDLAIEAARIALKYMTPVMYLSDAFLANGAEPWQIPSLDDLPDISVPNATDQDGLPALLARPGDARPTVGGPGHPGPRAPHRRPREGRRHRQRQLRPREPPPHADPAPAQRSPASPTTSRRWRSTGRTTATC